MSYVINPIPCICGNLIEHDKINDGDSVKCSKCGLEYVVTV